MMKCRTMLEEDIPSVAELEQQLFTDAWSEENIRGSLAQEHSICIVAECMNTQNEHQIAGYVLFYQSYDEGEILRIAVGEQFQRQGVGRHLFEALCNECKKRDVKHILLDVRESNTKARNFYEKEGFLVDGIRPRFYSKPEEDAVLMSFGV